MKNDDLWDEIIEEMRPVLIKSKCLINDIPQRVDNSQIGYDMNDKIDISDMISSFITDLNVSNNLFSLLEEKNIYWLMWDKLECVYNTSSEHNKHGRTSILNLMEKLITVSINNNILSLDDWNTFFLERKEADKITDVGEFVFKKVRNKLVPPKELSVYDYFYNKYSKEKIDLYLAEAKEQLTLACSYRELTKKQGQGLTRGIINFIHHWQNEGLLKPMKSVYPFCMCLEKYWAGSINLGTRQGLEATYKQRLQ